MHMRRMEGEKIFTDWPGKETSGKDVQHVNMIKDTNGNVMTHEENILKKKEKSILNN